MTTARPGQNIRQVTVLSVDPSSGKANCREATTSHTAEYPIIPAPTGMYPQPGQTWLLSKALTGGWVFAALVGGPRLVLASEPLGLFWLTSGATGQATVSGTPLRLPLDTTATAQGDSLAADLPNDRILVERAGSYSAAGSCGIVATAATGVRTIQLFWHDTTGVAETPIGTVTVGGVNGTAVLSATSRRVSAVPGDYFYAMVTQSSGAAGTLSNAGATLWLQVQEHAVGSAGAVLRALGLAQ